MATPAIAVYVQPASELSPIAAEQWQAWMAEWIQTLVPIVSLPAEATYEVSLQLVADAEIQSLNAQFRNCPQPTDVLAFAALENQGPVIAVSTAAPIDLGDIVISLETAVRQAEQIGHAVDIELAWLSAHGLLHLLGWDHPSKIDLEEMFQKQAQLLSQVGLPIPQWTADSYGYED